MATTPINAELLAKVIQTAKSGHVEKLMDAVTKAEAKVKTANEELEAAKNALTNGVPAELVALLTPSTASGKASGPKKGGKQQAKAFPFKNADELKEALEKKADHKIGWRPILEADYGKKMRALVEGKKGFVITEKEGSAYHSVTLK